MLQNIVAIVPARSGSKGLPGKNLLKIGGRTLIEIAVEEALKCGEIHQVILSSDTFEYLDAVSSKSDRLVKLLRSHKAAGDEATANDVVLDVLEKFPHTGQTKFIYLQPTSPLRNSSHISDAIFILKNSPSSSLVSVVASHPSPFKAVKISNSKIENFPWSIDGTANRQDLPDSFHPNGAIYIFSAEDFRAQNRIPLEGAHAFVMSLRDSVDIDTYVDYELARQLVENDEI